jgi:two-component system sensor histidine kinase KdpD
MASSRPGHEDFLELLERSRRGRLKVYIGPVAGVGKTYRMLQEAHALRKRGIDVALGFVEPHGRPETEALVAGLEAVPRRRFEHRELAAEEMDVEAVLARRPQVAIVDELAHVNVPGSRNAKRHQDVAQILDAGISVIGAVNVQHLESLNDLVARVAGVKVRQTLPDTFLRGADQVVNIDLSVDDLLERLEAGKIYPADKVPWALSTLFRREALGGLRELALREVADSVDRAGEAGPGRRLVSGRVMVCLASLSPRALTLMRRGSRFAGRLNTDWFVVYVETPEEAPHRIGRDAERQLLESAETARELGAEVVRLKARDPVRALVDFARSHGVAHILVGRTHKPWWRSLLGRSLPARLLDECPEFDLYVVAQDEEGAP